MSLTEENILVFLFEIFIIVLFRLGFFYSKEGENFVSNIHLNFQVSNYLLVEGFSKELLNLLHQVAMVDYRLKNPYVDKAK